MSLGKINEVIDLGKIFEGLTLEQIKQKILDEFHSTYGRYESVSGGMAFEMCHVQGDEAKVQWRKFEDGVLTEDLILTREEAIQRFMVKIRLGYQQVFSGVTAEDLKRENARIRADKSLLDLEGVLGTYRDRDGRYIRIKEYSKGVYTIEKGYGESLISIITDQSESATRTELEFALDAGYQKEGIGFEEPDSNTSAINILLGIKS